MRKFETRGESRQQVRRTRSGKYQKKIRITVSVLTYFENRRQPGNVLRYLTFKFKKMNCIIVDDEPLARQAIQKLVHQTENLEAIGSFNGAEATKAFLGKNAVDLIFLDIQMPGVNGIEFARTIPKTTLVVFTTA